MIIITIKNWTKIKIYKLKKGPTPKFCNIASETNLNKRMRIHLDFPVQHIYSWVTAPQLFICPKELNFLKLTFLFKKQFERKIKNNIKHKH